MKTEKEKAFEFIDDLLREREELEALGFKVEVRNASEFMRDFPDSEVSRILHDVSNARN